MIKKGVCAGEGDEPVKEAADRPDGPSTTGKPRTGAPKGPSCGGDAMSKLAEAAAEAAEKKKATGSN